MTDGLNYRQGGSTSAAVTREGRPRRGAERSHQERRAKESRVAGRFLRL